jgi:hypothetical protein
VGERISYRYGHVQVWPDQRLHVSKKKVELQRHRAGGGPQCRSARKSSLKTPNFGTREAGWQGQMVVCASGQAWPRATIRAGCSDRGSWVGWQGLRLTMASRFRLWPAMFLVAMSCLFGRLDLTSIVDFLWLFSLFYHFFNNKKLKKSRADSSI